MTPRTFTITRILLGLALVAIALLLLFGCTGPSRINDVAWGKPAILATDANGVLFVQTPAQPGLVPGILEVLGLVLGGFGFPVLALWCRSISKGITAAKTLTEAQNSKTDPPTAT